MTREYSSKFHEKEHLTLKCSLRLNLILVGRKTPGDLRSEPVFTSSQVLRRPSHCSWRSAV